MNTERSSYYLFAFVAVLYLFFNTAGLPEGLYYTTLLFPFFFIQLVKRQVLVYYLYFFLGSLALAGCQLPGVSYLPDYIVSFLLLQTLGVFVIFAWVFFQTATGTERVMKTLATVNIILVLVALLILPFTQLRPVLWYMVRISPGVPIIPRLKLLASEASYYSLVLFPVAGHYALKPLILKSRYYILLLSLCISLLLSFSLGVIITGLISIVLLFLFNYRQLKARINFKFLLAAGGVLIVGLLLLYFIFPNNPLFIRMRNIYIGQDTSAKGRITESFYIAWKIAGMKSLLFGTGLGQPKHIGKDFVNYYYMYSNVPVTRIYNAVADTFCIYGWVGVILRFFAIIFFFIRTKVWQNYYRQLLFIFIFIYQFTGSYLFNPAEYVMWILAFSSALLPQFNHNSKNLQL